MLSHALRRPLVALVSGLCIAGCSGGTDKGESSGTGGSSTSPIGLDGAGRANGGSSSQVGGDNGTTCGTSDPLYDCTGVSFESESIPLDIYILFDQSGSMLNDVGGMTRLAAVQLAVASFLRDPKSQAIGVGIGYFGYQPIGQVECDPARYVADVVVSSNHDLVLGSLDSRMPTGETPTPAALEGACRYASSYKSKNPGRNVVILLVTDGKPEAPVSCAAGGCCPTLNDAVAAASRCKQGNPQISTYVLGVGPNLDNLHAIAQAGGTKTAYLVGDQDVTRNVLDALNDIRRDAQIPCNIEIPPAAPNKTIDYDQVNVSSSKGSCSSTIYRVASASECTPEGGWHYDDPTTPSHIELCPASCALVNSASVGLKVLVGCASVTPPVR